MHEIHSPAGPSGVPQPLLPLRGPSSQVLSLVADVLAAGPSDIGHPVVLDYVQWPEPVGAATPELADPHAETRHMAQLGLMSRLGARLDMASVACDDVPGAAGSAFAPDPSVRFGQTSADQDARRYLVFRDRLADFLSWAPAAYGRLAQLVARDVDDAVAEACAADPDYRRELLDRLAVSDHAGDLPWERWRPETRGLAILYNFAPFADTGSTVASKRLRDFGRPVDVISVSYVNHKKIDPTIHVLSRPYVDQQCYLDMRPSWASWEAYEEFCREGLDQVTSWMAEGRDYEFLYSRAHWASSHYLAAGYKQLHPEVEWVAEFSDPLSLDVEGRRRGDALDRDNPFLSGLVAPVEQQYGRIPDDHFTIFGLAEILPYAQAETILFTNEHQMASMLEHVYSPELVARIERHARVSHHPTLPPVYYGARSVDYAVDPTKVNLAYFGEFYATRGITDLTVALKMLPPAVRDHVRLHVFTNFVPEGGLGARPPGFSAASFKALVKRAEDGIGAHGIEHLVEYNASLPYLEFLAVTAAFDYLIVNDAHSGPNHPVNPFLPSKWSDYAGSTTPVWALVEDGSILSGKPARVKTPVGDPNAAREMLWRLVEEKLGGRLDG
jgi:hypothetical protein